MLESDWPGPLRSRPHQSEPRGFAGQHGPSDGGKDGPSKRNRLSAHIGLLSAFVLTQERAHSAENPPPSMGNVPSGRTHRKLAILLRANKHKLV